MDNRYPTETREFYEEGIEQITSISVNIETIKDWFKDFESEPEYVYWVDKPFEYVRIYDEEKEIRYESVQMDIDDTIECIIEDISDIVSFNFENQVDINYEKLYPLIKGAVDTVTEEDISEIEYFKILYAYINAEADFYSEISTLIKDPTINSISSSRDEENVTVYSNELHGQIKTNSILTTTQLEEFIDDREFGQHLSDELIKIPFSDTKCRIICSNGDNPSLTIRKYLKSQINPIELLEKESVTLNELAYIWNAIENNRSIIFYGGTASGKTTSMESITYFIPTDSKIQCIQEAPEISLPFHNNAKMFISKDEETEKSTKINEMKQQKPNYLIYGELYSDVISDLLQVQKLGINLLTTMHADGPKNAMVRLHNPPINANLEDLIAVDLLIGCNRESNASQNISDIYEVTGFSDEYTEGTNIQINFNKVNQSNIIGSSTSLEEVDEEGIKRKKHFLLYLLNNQIKDDATVYKLIQDFQSESSTITDLSEWIETKLP